MPDPIDLLAVARLLSAAPVGATPSDAQLRRAVSTAYYAVFHNVLRAAAERFMGENEKDTAGFTLLYRGFNHGQIRIICEALQSPVLKDKFRYNLRRSSVSQDMRDFAGAFPSLQDARHRADYDPSAHFLPSHVASLVDEAAEAIAAFNRVAPDEKADILALMMVGSRI